MHFTYTYHQLLVFNFSVTVVAFFAGLLMAAFTSPHEAAPPAHPLDDRMWLAAFFGATFSGFAAALWLAAVGSAAMVVLDHDAVDMAVAVKLLASAGAAGCCAGLFGSHLRRFIAVDNQRLRARYAQVRGETGR